MVIFQAFDSALTRVIAGFIPRKVPIGRVFWVIPAFSSSRFIPGISKESSTQYRQSASWHLQKTLLPLTARRMFPRPSSWALPQQRIVSIFASINSKKPCHASPKESHNTAFRTVELLCQLILTDRFDLCNLSLIHMERNPA